MKKPSTILEQQEIKKGQSYKLKELPCGVNFQLPGSTDLYSTITHPNLARTMGNYNAKRDCWNETQKRMELIQYNQQVIIFSENIENSEN